MRMTRRGMIVAALTGCLLGLPLGHVAADASTRPLPQHRGYHACEWEDSPGPCWWDAGSAGNGRGHSFYVTRDQRVVYGTLKWRVLGSRLSSILPDARRCAHPRGAYADDQWCLTVGPWHRMGSGRADALAEGGSPNADDRDWQRTCFVHRNGPEHLVACTDGYIENM